MKEIHVVRAKDLSLTRPLRFAYASMASEKHPPKRIFHINFLSVCLGSVCLGPVCLGPCLSGPCTWKPLSGPCLSGQGPGTGQQQEQGSMISDGIAIIFLEIVIIPVWASAYVGAYVNSFLGLRFCLRFGPSVYKQFPRTYDLLKGGFFS